MIKPLSIAASHSSNNGSGKTTLARHLVGLLKPTNKDAVLMVKDQDIRKMRVDKIIRMINYVFQNPDDQLFAETIWDEIAFAPRMVDYPEDQVKQLTEESMKVFGLNEHQDRYIYGLDEDLKTYLAISCILPLHPDVLLIDEPTTGLDTQGEVKMMESPRFLRDTMGKTIVIITQAGPEYYMLGREFRFATVVTWAIIFLYTTSIGEIANTLYAMRVPTPIVFVVQITYKFIPYVSSIINQIQSAQKLRGWHLRTINLVKLFKRSLPLANPLMRRTAMIVEQVTTATQIRGFGSGKVTALRDLTLSLLDKVIIVFSIACLILAVFALIFFKAGMI